LVSAPRTILTKGEFNASFIYGSKSHFTAGVNIVLANDWGLRTTVAIPVVRDNRSRRPSQPLKVSKTGLHTFRCDQTKGIEIGDDYGEFVVEKA